MNTATVTSQELIVSQSLPPTICRQCGCLPDVAATEDLLRCRLCNTDLSLRRPGRGRSESEIFFERVAADVRSGSVSPVYALFSSIARAEHFIHYVVEGMGSGVAAILRDAVNRRVAVRGVAGATVPGTPARPGGESLLDGTGLIVVDGQLAFKGPGVVSSNVWARAALIPGLLTVTVDSFEVTLWNNNLFSPFWMEQSVHGYGSGPAAASRSEVM